MLGHGATMRVRRVVLVALAASFAATLGACSPFSGYVADAWPHWAGGEPAGIPPRPGAPGYEKFIAHGQPAQNPSPSGAQAQPAATDATAAIATAKPAAAQKPPAYAEPSLPEPSRDVLPVPPLKRPENDPSVVQGGLY